ncbi:hypothetical protein ACFY7Y_40470 [Streptomyces virginiae]|uniref:hypothetical protein n=1 Tax=Streptomyces virginiae TaxID=1961 RepID=UPI00368D609F
MPRPPVSTTKSGPVMCCSSIGFISRAHFAGGADVDLALAARERPTRPGPFDTRALLSRLTPPPP